MIMFFAMRNFNRNSCLYILIGLNEYKVVEFRVHLNHFINTDTIEFFFLYTLLYFRVDLQ